MDPKESHMFNNCTSYLAAKMEMESRNDSETVNLFDHSDYSLASLSKVVVGGVSFLLILPFVLFTFKKLPIGTTAAVLFGAFCMVIGGVMDQEQVYKVVGKKDHMQTIFLLLGMMIISLFFERERLLDRVLATALKTSLGFPQYIIVIGAITFVVSALFTNDACCVIMTPILLKHWLFQNRNSIELETILLTIATSSNLGSVTTIFGNPQMALIAARTDSRLYELSRLDLTRCIMYLGPPALIIFAINCGLLILNYKFALRRAKVKQVRTEEPDNSSSKDSSPRHQIPISSCHGLYQVSCPDISNVNGKEDAEIGSNECVATTTFGATIKGSDSKRNIFVDVESYLKNSNSRVFKILLILIIVLVIALFFSSSHAVTFDIGLVPVGGAIILLVADAIINGNNAVKTLHHLDWSILMMFFGIFVWLDGLNSTRLPRWLWSRLNLVGQDFSSFSSLSALFLFVLIGSNIFSNVPLTIIVLEQVPPCENHFALIIYLSWVATIAGNLTLFGSVANLIVAQKAEETLSFRLTFWKHLRFCFVTTIVLNFSGMAFIFGLLLLY